MVKDLLFSATHYTLKEVFCKCASCDEASLDMWLVEDGKDFTVLCGECFEKECK